MLRWADLEHRWSGVVWKFGLLVEHAEIRGKSHIRAVAACLHEALQLRLVHKEDKWIVSYLLVFGFLGCQLDVSKECFLIRKSIFDRWLDLSTIICDVRVTAEREA